MQQLHLIFVAAGGKNVTKNEPNSFEEVGLACTVLPDDAVMTWAERVDDGLIFVGAEALDDDLFDVHGCKRAGSMADNKGG